MNLKNTYCLKIADIPFSVRFDKGLDAKKLMRIFNGYETTQKPFFSLDVFSSEEAMPLKDDACVKMARHNGHISLSLKQGRSTRALGAIGCIKRKGDFCVGPKAAKSLFFPFLVYSYAYYAVQKEGLMLHAAGCVDKKDAYLFVGPSGAGKTTVAGFLRRRGITVLSDEKIVIKKKGKDFYAYPFPWRGSVQKSAKIKGIFFLKKSKEVSLKKLSSVEALMRLFKCLTLNFPDEKIISKALTNLDNFASQAPCYQLSFAKNISFWSKIKETL